MGCLHKKEPILNMKLHYTISNHILLVFGFGAGFLDILVVTDDVLIVDGTDGLDGVGTGCRLINHLNFWQCISF